jgi:arylsulfatase A-like enzyme
MDSVRWDHCGFSGYERDTTPFLSSLKGAQFEIAHANAPYTPASVPSLLSSTYPLEDSHVVYRDDQIIPDYFNDTSYTTGIAFNNIQIERFGFADKFDYSMNLSQNNVELSTDSDAESRALGDDVSTLTQLKDQSVKFLQDHKRLRSILQDTYHRFREIDQPHPTDAVVTDRAIDWIGNQSDPYFLWIHYMDTHHPHYFLPKDFQDIYKEEFDPKKYSRILSRAKTHVQSGEFTWDLSDEQKDYLIAAYDASILHLDGQIQRLMDKVSEHKTNVIISSDHGEELWDREHFGHAARPSKPRPMSLYEEMLHVPLIINGPGIPDVQIESPVSLVDLLPTILDMSDIPQPTDIRGDSLIPLIQDSDTEAQRDIVAHATSPGDPSGYYEQKSGYILGSIQRNNHKYVYYENKSDELFNISKDPNEHHNCINESDEMSRELRTELLNTINDSIPKQIGGREQRDVEEQLRRLGYKE